MPAQWLSTAVIPATLDPPWTNCSPLFAAAACCCGPAGTCCVPANTLPPSNSIGGSTGSSSAPQVQAMVGLGAASQAHSLQYKLCLSQPRLSASLALLCILGHGAVHQC